MFGSKLSLDFSQSSWLEGENLTRQFIENVSGDKTNRKILNKGLTKLQKMSRKDGATLGARLTDGDVLCLTLKSPAAGTIKQPLKDFYGDPLHAPYNFIKACCTDDTKSLQLYRLDETFLGLIDSYKQALDARKLSSEATTSLSRLLKRFNPKF